MNIEQAKDKYLPILTYIVLIGLLFYFFLLLNVTIFRGWIFVGFLGFFQLLFTFLIGCLFYLQVKVLQKEDYTRSLIISLFIFICCVGIVVTGLLAFSDGMYETKMKEIEKLKMQNNQYNQ